MNEIENAREQYRKGEITFKELDQIFWKEATQAQKEEFWNAPVFDRPSVIIGHSKKQRDAIWNDLING